MDKAFSFIEGQEINLSGVKLPLQTAIVALLTIFSGLGVILQDSFVNSSQILPENTIECWDALEESGSLALISRENSIGEPMAAFGNIIISGQFIPPLKGTKYYSLLKTGDGSRIPDTAPLTFKAVLETPGVSDKIDDLIGLQLDSNWTVVGEVEGACRIWVHQDSIRHLNPEITWEMVDARWPMPEAGE